MRRLATIRGDLENAAADLELLANFYDDKGFPPAEGNNLRAQAGAIMQVVARLSSG